MVVRLGELLVQEGVLTEAQLHHALAQHGQSGEKLGTDLLDLGFVSEQVLAQALGRQLNVPSVDAGQVARIPTAVVDILPRNVAQKYRAVPLRIENRVLYVCMDDPTNLGGIDAVRFATNCAVKPLVTPETTLDYALERYYGVAGRRRCRQSEPNPIFGGTGEQRELCYEQGHERLASGHEIHDPESVSTLAAVQTSLELVDLVRAFIVRSFRQAVVLQVGDNEAVAVAQHGLSIGSVGLGRIRTQVLEGSQLHDAIAHERVIFRDTTQDASVLKVCALARIRPHNITLIPVGDGQRIAYVALCTGLTRDQLRTQYPRLRRFVGRVCCAFQILALRQRMQQL